MLTVARDKGHIQNGCHIYLYLSFLKLVVFTSSTYGVFSDRYSVLSRAEVSQRIVSMETFFSVFCAIQIF